MKFNGRTQEESSPRLISFRQTASGGGNDTYNIITPGVESLGVYTDIWVDHAFYKYLRFLVSSNEVRPRNIAIKIWKRTK